MSIQLPIFQHFDCQSCGYCCRNLVVNITSAERRKIVEAGWENRIPGRALFIEYRFGRRHLIRLAHTAEHACVFLGGDGRCRLHAETGVATKPLACRLYPFVPTPGVGSVRLDLRADCPSVAANEGRSVSVHRAEIAGLARETGAEISGRAPVWHGISLDAEEFDALVKAFDDCLCEGSLSPRGRFQAAAHLLELLLSVQAGRVRGDRFAELMGLLSTTAIEEASQASSTSPPIAAKPLHLFRQWLFLHAIADDPDELTCGRIERLRRSWRRYGQSRRFSAESGEVPLVRADWPRVTFEKVGAVGPAPDAAIEPIIRSMRVKLHAHAFAGPAYFHYDLLSGLTALLLLPALVGWFARFDAAAAGRDVPSAADVLAGVRKAHHTFGVSPVFSRVSERLRLRALSRPGVTLGLLGRYAP